MVINSHPIRLIRYRLNGDYTNVFMIITNAIWFQAAPFVPIEYFRLLWYRLPISSRYKLT